MNSHVGGDGGQTAVILPVHVWLLSALIVPPEKIDMEGALSYLSAHDLCSEAAK